ncbi:MAG: tyrosine-type recombinase/integrase, partial [Gemmatimonadales bacterium]
KGKSGRQLMSRTQQKHTVLLTMLFRYAVELDWRASLPVRKEHRVSVMKEGERRGKLRGDQRVGIALTPPQLDAIVDQLEHPDTLLVRLTAWTGLREGEVTHLRMMDVSPNADLLTVASGIPCHCRDCRLDGGERLTKSGRARVVPVAPELVPDLRAYVAERVERFGPDGWLFPRWFRPTRGRYPAASQRSHRDVLTMFRAAAEAAEAEAAEAGEVSPMPSGRLRFHDLRTTAHTWLTERSRGHLVAVSVALGHRLPGMAEVYNRLAANPDLLRAALFPDAVPPHPLAVVK